MKEKMSFKTSILLSNVVLGVLVLIQALVEIVFKYEVELWSISTTKNGIINDVANYILIAYEIALLVMFKRGRIKFNDEQKHTIFSAVQVTALLFAMFVIIFDGSILLFKFNVSIGAGMLYVPIGIALIVNGLLTLLYARNTECEAA